VPQPKVQKLVPRWAFLNGLCPPPTEAQPTAARSFLRLDALGCTFLNETSASLKVSIILWGKLLKARFQLVTNFKKGWNFGQQVFHVQWWFGNHDPSSPPLPICQKPLGFSLELFGSIGMFLKGRLNIEFSDQFLISFGFYGKKKIGWFFIGSRLYWSSCKASHSMTLFFWKEEVFGSFSFDIVDLVWCCVACFLSVLSCTSLLLFLWMYHLFLIGNKKKKEKEFDKTSTSSAILLRWISAFHSSIMIVVQWRNTIKRPNGVKISSELGPPCNGLINSSVDLLRVIYLCHLDSGNDWKSWH